MYRPIYTVITILVIGIISTLSAHERLNHTTVKRFDLVRYLGRWHEIARFDHKFERGLSCVTAYYSVMENGVIKVENRGYNAEKEIWSSAIGKAKTTSTTGRLRVSFFLFFYSDYNILALGEESIEGLPADKCPYSWALVGSKSDKYLWILSRTEQLDADTFEYILKIAESRGYDTDDLLIAEPCSVKL